MFYRRKVILSLLQLFDGQLDKIRLQKLLFLFTNKQTLVRQGGKAEYDFIPYKFGCYSYSANADMTAMVRKGFLNEDEKHFSLPDLQAGKTDKTDYLKQLKPDDKKLLQEVKANYGRMSATALMKHTYINFPFYAIKSEVAENILTKDEFEKVSKAKTKGNKTVLYTIGYEGISLEEYLVRLLKNDVKVLVDVRNNPLSMKYGFSKSQLKKYCASLGIGYVHIPEVGIQSDQRQELNTQSDYDKLFAVYRKNNLSKTSSYQNEILKLLKQHKRIALTCFEANICQCHRKHLAEAIENLPDFNYEVKHI
ncbi:MAG: DUF488 domain-containing protein [Verrucomicrobia bacterium]|nr:DUF488 domain-containing protein [Verrucomicrobiota bacterium]MBS1947616.1 DUF488 domain-containing protein [Bacteroidota bacterium]